MNHDGDRADVRTDDRRATAALPLAALVDGAPSCQVVHLLEDWDRGTCAQALRLAEDLRQGLVPVDRRGPDVQVDRSGHPRRW